MNPAPGCRPGLTKGGCRREAGALYLAAWVIALTVTCQGWQAQLVKPWGCCRAWRSQAEMVRLANSPGMEGR